MWNRQVAHGAQVPAVIGTYWKYGMVRFPMITVAVRTMGRFCKAGGTAGLRLLVRWWHNLVLSESYGWNFAKVPYLSMSLLYIVYNEHCFWTKIWDFNMNLAVNKGNPRVVGQLNPMNICGMCVLGWFGPIFVPWITVDIILLPIDLSYLLMLYLRFLKSWGYPQIIQVMDDHESWVGKLKPQRWLWWLLQKSSKSWDHYPLVI